MKYEGFTTFSVDKADGILIVTFDFGSVNVQGQEMLADFSSLAMRLERDRAQLTYLAGPPHQDDASAHRVMLEW